MNGMSIIKKYTGVVITAMLAGVSGSYMYQHFMADPQTIFVQKTSQYESHRANYQTAQENGNFDFVLASGISTQSVVYVKTISAGNLQYNTFDWFFGNGGAENQVASAGSGVI